MNKRITLLMVIVLLMVSGCSGYRDVTVRQGGQQKVFQTIPPLSEGDTLRYALKNGSEGTIKFHEISQNMLVGQDGRHIPLELVTRLERKEFSGGKTAAAAGAGIGVGAVIITVVLAAGLTTALIAAGG
ncbi:hypothetical protein ACSN7O_004855 [Enterobacter chuandaensis]